MNKSFELSLEEMLRAKEFERYMKRKQAEEERPVMNVRKRFYLTKSL